jgi:linoleate 8R-lipoxygenase/9,12-octadecadienoate 8-hydroperoxide 8R-isomerase
MHPNIMPNPGTLFDGTSCLTLLTIALVVRKEYKPHPKKISSLLYYMTVLISHDLSRPSMTDTSINMTSSYLDLSPLYGSSLDEQKLVRTFQNGTLKPDTVSETRLELYPPGVSALLICFNRFHNYVAAQLREINEGGRFSLDEGAAKLDNEVFQTARLYFPICRTNGRITCGMYMNIIMNDYIPTLIGIPELNAARILDPSVFGDDAKSSIATGNQVSCEFSLIYPFHMMISDRDDKYMQSLLQKIFPGKHVSRITAPEYQQGIAAFLSKFDQDPSKRNLAGLSRTGSGTFDNTALVNILTASTEDCAGTPHV